MSTRMTRSSCGALMAAQYAPIWSTMLILTTTFAAMDISSDNNQNKFVDLSI